MSQKKNLDERKRGFIRQGLERTIYDTILNTSAFLDKTDSNSVHAVNKTIAVLRRVADELEVLTEELEKNQ